MLLYQPWKLNSNDLFLIRLIFFNKQVIKLLSFLFLFLFHVKTKGFVVAFKPSLSMQEELTLFSFNILFGQAYFCAVA